MLDTPIFGFSLRWFTWYLRKSLTDNFNSLDTILDALDTRLVVVEGGGSGPSELVENFTEFRKFRQLWLPRGQGTVVDTWGMNALQTVGTVAGAGFATTSLFWRMPRLSIASSAGAGSLAQLYSQTVREAQVNAQDEGGFHLMCRYAVADAAVVAGARMFIGLWNQADLGTNVNPSTMTNCMGLAQIDGSANLHIVFGGSAAQTPIDLGSDFPADANRSSDVYELSLYSQKGTNDAGFGEVTYHVRRVNTGQQTNGVISGTPGVALPSYTTMLSFLAWRCNNATALAVKLHMGALSINENL